jgi:excinuclease ABC subunit A
VKSITIRGAREHNLKNIDLDLPRDSFIVVSGISGSGKSSLAFDTIFAEGQRRYVESLSAYARQFLGRLDKPDLDYIEGLSPAISIEQKSTPRNPRSTVGTVTEIYDYLRLLFARVGIPHCPQCGREIKEQSVDQIVDALLALPDQTRIVVMAPVIRGRKGEHRKIIEDARRAGFVRIRVDGTIRSLDETITPDKKRKHNIEIVVDRLLIKEGVAKRLADSVETALEVASGQLIVSIKTEDGQREELYSQSLACPVCGISVPELQPRTGSHRHTQSQGQLASQHLRIPGPALRLRSRHVIGGAFPGISGHFALRKQRTDPIQIRKPAEGRAMGIHVELQRRAE